MTEKYGYEFSLYDGALMHMPNYMYVLASDINSARDYIKQAFPSFTVATMRKLSDDPIANMEELEMFLENVTKLK